MKLSAEQVGEIKKSIFEWLCNNCAGSLQAKPRYELHNYLSGKGFVVSDREMRSLIEEMRREHFLIGSSEQGYYLIDTVADLVKARDYLKKKAESIAIAQNTLQTAWNMRFEDLAAKQLELIREVV